MNRAGEISVAINPEARDYRRVILWYQRKRKVLITAIVTILLLMLGLVFSGNLEGPKILGVRLEFVLVAVTMPFMYLGFSLFGAWKQAKKIESISEPTMLTFDAKGIKSVSSSSETSVNWSRFDKIVETNEDFIVFPQENIFYSVPKRFFEEHSKVDDLRILLRERLGSRAKMKS